MKKYKIIVLHLSHTDIGYKDTQAQIKYLQIMNLLNIVNEIEKYPNFVWNIESFGILQEFLKTYPNYEKEVARLIKAKKIGISTNFWNYTKIAAPFLIHQAFKKVLVWMGDQYAVGNNFGIVPGPISDYIVSDGKVANNSLASQIALANERIQDLLKQLNNDNYPYGVIPLTVLGTGADNDPVNFAITRGIKVLAKEWKKYGIESIEMGTLQDFFDAIKNKDKIPTYQGEWPDWWADGAASLPFALKSFKEAQRSYKTYLRLGNKPSETIEDNLLLYAEHTYGTKWATLKPCSFYNKQTEGLKNFRF